jgi:hypothetical protein
MHEKVFKELPENPGKEILQVEGVKHACDEDIQEIFKRDVETETKDSKNVSTSSRRITLKWTSKTSRTGNR